MTRNSRRTTTALSLLLLHVHTVIARDCPLWIAPSNTDPSFGSHNGDAQSKPFTKWGLYAGKAYPQNASLPLSELAIPLIDFFGDFHKETDIEAAIFSFLEGQLWAPSFLGSQLEGHLSTPGLVPGVGALANYHTSYSNVNFLQAALLKREPMVGGPHYPPSGEAHLLRGAVTPYYNATLMATEHIPAGMELFADFGDDWDGNFTENVYQDKIHRYDYDIADNLVDALIAFYEKFPDLSIDLQEDIMDFMLQNVLQTATGANAKTIRSLIPDNPRKLKKVKKTGGTFMFRYRDMVKSSKWLQQNGFCLDTIRQGISKIQNAGRGAFAARNIRKGETITVTPMIHIADREMMDMYPIKIARDKESGIATSSYDDSEDPMEEQLLLNYAFGHRKSSMLLLPIGPQVTLMNHDGKSSNAAITWSHKSSDVIRGSKIYRDFTVEQMSAVSDIVLVMKVVARRNIREGEEITLNYGAGWQEAWNEYESEWNNHGKGKSHPLKADDLKSMYNDKPYETVETLVDNPYPEDVHLACFLETVDRPDGTPMTHQKHGWDITNFEEPVTDDAYDGVDLCKVTVLERKEAAGFFYNYTIRARTGDGDMDIEEVTNVPHSACTFIDLPYSSDIHLPGAFRHYIEIPDPIFPRQWENIRVEEFGGDSETGGQG
ncbi:MAG: hypothetical protein SGILL_004773 [Bacillariaceae sp.]